MALSDFFHINLPYAIRGSKEKGWLAINREYKPLGFNNLENVKYENYPLYTKYKGLTDKVINELSDNDKTRIIIDDKGNGDTIVFLYNSRSNPLNKNHSMNWERYYSKLQLLSKLKVVPK